MKEHDPDVHLIDPKISVELETFYLERYGLFGFFSFFFLFSFLFFYYSFLLLLFPYNYYLLYLLLLMFPDLFFHSPFQKTLSSSSSPSPKGLLGLTPDEIMQSPSLGQALLTRTSRNPNQTILVWIGTKGNEEESITIGELVRNAKLIWDEMKKKGIKKGDHVALCFAPCLLFAQAFFACVFAGFFIFCYNLSFFLFLKIKFFFPFLILFSNLQIN